MSSPDPEQLSPLSAAVVPNSPGATALEHGSTLPAPRASTDETPGVRRPSRRHQWWAVPLATVGILAAATPIVASFVPATLFEKTRCVEFGSEDADGDGRVDCVRSVEEAVQFAVVPASADAVGPRLTITGATTYPTDADIHFVTVVEPEISSFDYWVVHDDPAARLHSYRDKYGDRTPQQLVEAGQQQMRTAKDDAMFVALQAAGYEVELVPGEVVIDALICLEANEAGTECLQFTPADDVLDPNDTIVAVNGTTVNIVTDLAAALRDVKPGEAVTVDFIRDGEEMSGEVTTIAAPGEDPVRTIIGFIALDTTTVKLPDGIEVEIGTEGIGGPSAGLAFTLTLIDALTPGSLIGNNDIAVTGTIDLDGNVGAIGGLNSKTSAVKQMGVRYFIVPVNQGEDGIDGLTRAREVAGDDVEIIPVATLQEALDALVDIGGDPIDLEPLATG